MDTENNRAILIKELIDLITKGNAHVTFNDAVANLALDKLTVKPDNLPYNLWQLTEHIRITQWDILQFCIDPKYQSPPWPQGYWPDASDIPGQQQWDNCIQQIKNDRHQFIQLLKDPAVDLYQPFAHGSGQNLFREALLIADHTAYHTGEIIVIRRLLQIWPG